MTKSYKMKSMPSAQCHVEIKRNNKSNELESIRLVSYSTSILVIYLDDNKAFNLDVNCRVNYSPTTARHVNRFTTEFFGMNLYHTLKLYDFEHPVPYYVDDYSVNINEMCIWYECNGKLVY